MPLNRDEILGHIETSLNALNGSIGSGLTLAVPVQREFVNYDDIPRASMPFLCFFPTKGPSPEHFPFAQVRKRLTVKIIGHAQALPQSTKTDAIAQFEEDVSDAMAIDPTRGGWAVDTIEIDSAETDEGVPEKGGRNSGTATAVMTYQIMYYPND